MAARTRSPGQAKPGQSKPGLARTCVACGHGLEPGALLCSNCGEPAVEGERKLVTILFADLAGYTAMAAALDPEDVYLAVRPWMTAMRLIVEDHGGSVPQVMGDGFMAVFGVPAAHEDDAERAVRAGLELIRYGARLRDGEDPGFPGVHAGVNSGEVLVGGSREASGFVVVGDPVNLAARLADIAGAGQLLVGEQTRELTRHGRIRYGPLSLRAARGKGAPLRTYEARSVGVPRKSVSALSGSTRARPGQAARPRLSPFVDRVSVLRRLSAELDRVAGARQARVRVVVDEPGVGKSRLADELAARRPDVLVLRGACQPYGQRLPLSALADAVGGHLGIGSEPSRPRVRRAAEALTRADDPSSTAQLEAQLAALVAPHAGSRRAGGAVARPPGGAGIDATSAVRPVLRAIADGQPLVVVLDDLHWAHPDLVAFLREVHAAPWPEPVLFLALARPEPEDRHRGLPLIRLGGLRPAEARQVLRGTVDGSLPAVATTRLIERAAGNPLFLEESARMLIERGAIVRSRGRWIIPKAASLEIVPASLRLLIAARLDGLASAEKRVLQDASISGGITWHGLLEELARTRQPGRTGGVEAALQALEDRDLLRSRPESSIPGMLELEFKHVVIRDVAYESLPRSARAAGHLTAARWIEGHAGDSAVAALAHHYERAWELSRSRTQVSAEPDTGRRAADYLRRWGDEVFAVQPRLAESLYDRGLAIARAIGAAVDGSVMSGLLVGRAESLAELGRHQEAIRESRRALELATGNGPSDGQAYALLALARAHSNLGEVGVARDLIHEADRVFEATGTTVGRARAAHRLAEASRFDDFRTETDSYRRAYALYRRAGSIPEQAMVAQDLAYLLTVAGGSEWGRWFERASRLVAASGDERGRAALHRASAYASWYRSEPDRAVEAAREARPLAAEIGDRWIEVDSMLVEAQVLATSGAPADAERLLRQLGAIARSAGARHLRALVMLAGARPAQRLGRPVRATRRVATARRILVELGVAMELAEVDLAEAALLLERGAWNQVAGPASAGEDRAQTNGWRLLVPLGSLLRGRADLGAGRLSQAACELQRAARQARSVGATGTLTIAAAALDQISALERLAGKQVGDFPLAGAGGQAESDGDRGQPGDPRLARHSKARPPFDEAAAIRLETAGLRALRAGNYLEATTSFRAAVRTWNAVGLTAWQARAEGFRARALEADGRRTAAGAARRRVGAMLKAIGGQESSLPEAVG